MTKKEIHKSQQEKTLTKCLAPTVGLRKALPQKVLNTSTNKVSADISIPCKNRFQALSFDTIAKPSSDTKTCNSNITQFNRRAITKASVKNQHHASINDADARLLKLDTHECHDTESLKYDIPFRVKNKVQNYKSALPYCATLRLLDVQNKHKFGFIPLTSLQTSLLPSLPREDGGQYSHALPYKKLK